MLVIVCHRYASIGVYKGLGWDTMHHFLQFFLFCGKNIWFSLCGFPPRYIGWAAASYLGNTSFMGTKKDKRYACLLYCISTTLSFKFLFMFSSPFQGSLKFFFTYEQWIYMYISIFSLFIVCLFRLKVCGLLPLPSSERVGENVAYRMLSFTLTHIPIAAIAANRLIIIVMFIFLKPFLSFFSILKSSTQSSFYTIFQLKTSIHHLVFIFTFIHHWD